MTPQQHLEEMSERQIKMHKRGLQTFFESYYFFRGYALALYDNGLITLREYESAISEYCCKS